MNGPSVAVITYPHVYTTLIARLLHAGGYRVEAPDVGAGSWEPDRPFDVVIASLPVPRGWGHILVQLPRDFAEPITVSVGDLTVHLDISTENPIEDIVAVLDRLDLDRRSATAHVTLIAMAKEGATDE